MNPELMKTLRDRLGERARFNQPLAPRTTWGAGGPVWGLCRVRDAAEAAFVIRAARGAGLPWMPLGRGSNLLVRDGGYPGVMLRLTGPLARLAPKGSAIEAGAGAGLPAAVRLAARLGLAGLEWAVGIPATVGGAVASNAGAHGGWMSRAAPEITLLSPDGRTQKIAGRDLPAAYRRRSLPPESLVLAARLELAPDDPGRVAQRTRKLMEARRKSQPVGARTAGSVFKNPPGDHAGRLIEAAGCKGLARGDAVVSDRHANFIENRGRASAADILALIAEASRRVRDACGVELELEVKVVGRD